MVLWGDGGVRRLRYDVHQALSFSSLYIELPATTVGEWWRRHSLRRHKGGLWLVPLTSRHPGCFSNLSLRIVQQARRSVTTQEAAVSRVTLASNSLTCWGRCKEQRVTSCGHAGSRVTGARTSGSVGMLGPRVRLTSGQPPQGVKPKNWRATDPRNGGQQLQELDRYRYLF